MSDVSPTSDAVRDILGQIQRLHSLLVVAQKKDFLLREDSLRKEEVTAIAEEYRILSDSIKKMQDQGSSIQQHSTDPGTETHLRLISRCCSADRHRWVHDAAGGKDFLDRLQLLRAWLGIN